MATDPILTVYLHLSDARRILQVIRADEDLSEELDDAADDIEDAMKEPNE